MKCEELDESLLRLGWCTANVIGGIAIFRVIDMQKPFSLKGVIEDELGRVREIKGHELAMYAANPHYKTNAVVESSKPHVDYHFIKNNDKIQARMDALEKALDNKF